MELRDFIVTPIVLILTYAVAYIIKPYVSDPVNRRYFFPALSAKIVGALALGLVYQFYYHGGDTFNYHSYGSRVIWDAFTEAPGAGLRLIFYPDVGSDPALYRYSSKILFFHDPSSYFVIRITAFLDLFTFSSYAATAVLFAVIGFAGMWLLFLAFYGQYPHLHKWIAISAFFIPSVFFWGSGILKDTLIMAALGAITFTVKRIFFDKKIKIGSILLLMAALVMTYHIKKYVLLCFLPAAFFWVFAGNLSRIRSIVLRMILFPFIILIAGFSGYFAVKKIGEDDPKYALDKLAKTSRVTAYDIGFYTGRDAGSGYSLGELDDSFGGMLRLAPQAINVALFRPYLWEVKNPLMLLSAIESLLLLGTTLYLLITLNVNFFRFLNNPNVLFCMLFSITFAFAVGVSTFNFGSLARYKIPLLPFYLIGLVLIADQSNRERKLAVLDVTE